MRIEKKLNIILFRGLLYRGLITWLGWWNLPKSFKGGGVFFRSISYKSVVPKRHCYPDPIFEYYFTLSFYEFN